MPPDPLPLDRKDFVKERKPSSSDPVGIAPARLREPPTTPSYHNNRGSSSSYRRDGGGHSDFRRPFSGYDKAVSGGSHVSTVESGPREYKYCKNDNRTENNTNISRMVALGSQKDQKVGNPCATNVSPNSNSHPLSYSVNSLEQLQSSDQHAKNNGGEVSTSGSQILEKENTVGSSIDWKPLKWTRSGSLSSRGSSFSHSSSCKIIGVESLDTKFDAPRGNNTPVQSPSGDVVTCLTPRTLADEGCSRKKPRLGWGEGLAKYEKKKVGPYDNVDKESGAGNEMVDGVSSSEPLLSSPSNLPDKSPSLTGCSECASPTTPYSFACSSSPGLEEKDGFTKAATMNNDTCNPSVSFHPPQNHPEGLAFNLENLEITEGLNLSSTLDQLLQSDDIGTPGTGFVRSTAMDKLQVWKADISRTLEITETEIDSLEHELKLLNSYGGSCPFPAASSLPTENNSKNLGKRFGPLPLKVTSSGDMPMVKADCSLEERIGDEDLARESPGTATSKFVEPLALCDNVKHPDAVEQKDSPFNLDIRSEKAKIHDDHASDDMLGVVTLCRDGSQVPAGSNSTVPIGGDVHYHRENKLCDMILASNRVLASRASDAFSKMLPTTHLRTNISRASNESLIRKKIAMRKHFIKFKERVIALKFRALQYSWKEDLHLLSVRRFGAKSQKKFELSSRMGYADHHHKHESSIHSRLSSAGSLSLVPTVEMIDYVNKLLSDSRIRIYRNTLKMPSLILDKREHIASRFISDNGLVENPVDVEKERSIINPWTMEEKEIFLDKYALFGKNFRKIASFFEHKTIADCVEFYYKNHKSDRFQKTKKNLEFAKGKPYTTNTYLVTSGKRLNRETAAISLDMLGAASAMVANMDDGVQRQQKYTPNYHVGSSSDKKLPGGDGGTLERSNDFAMFCNEQETAAADVLAGICRSISSEALSSCITSSVEPGRRCQKLSGSSLHLTPEGTLDDVDEETCSDNSCGEDMDTCDWTDEERSKFVQAVRSHGKDFPMISRYMGTRSRDECRVFFSKARKCLGLDVTHLEPGSEGTTGANQGGGSDHEDGCGSVISHDKSSSECNKIDMHLPDLREEHAESDRNGCSETELVLENLASHAEKSPQVELVGESSSNGNLEGAADSEATETADVPPNTYSGGSAGEMNDYSSASGVAKVYAKNSRQGISISIKSEHQLPSLNGDASSVRGLSSCPVEDLNSAPNYSGGTCLDLSIDGVEINAASETGVAGNGFVMPNLFPRRSGDRKTLSQDDASSRRLSFRKSGDQRCSSTDGYHLHLSKRSLLDCEESSQFLPVGISSSGKEGKSGSVSCNEPRSNIQQQRQSCSLERPSRSGDVKLFGQIITNLSGSNANGSVRESGKPNDGRFYNLKFDNDTKKVPPLRRSYGFWDGNRIQILPDSAMLLAKYPAAFGNSSSKLDSCSLNEQGKLNGFQSRKVNYHHEEDKFRIEMGRSIDEQQVVSDPVAAIRMQYGKTTPQEYKNGGESW